MIILETERLILKELDLTRDIQDFFEYAKDPEVGPNAGWMPHTSINESKEILKNMINSKEVFGIFIKGSLKLIGTIGLHHVDNKVLFQREMGYALAKNYWNYGYMTEAAFAMVNYGFEEMLLESIVAGYFEHNMGSKKIQDKLGFQFRHIDTTDKYLPFSEVVITTILTKDRYFTLYKGDDFI